MTGMPSSVMNAGSASWKEYANAGQSFRRALNSAMSAEGRYSKYSLYLDWEKRIKRSKI